jgi:pantoate--beta-alanine ligase
MKVVKTVKEMQSLADGLRKDKRIGFVPTMGYLHEGHLALVRKARELSDIVVVSIFVNPIQFGPTEDLSRYPRDFARDAELLENEKTDIIFYPEAGDVYPEGYSTYVEVKGLEDYLCGKTRTGHFVGVATVVNKLFNIVKPHFAVFGQKDYQQLRIIEKMVRDLNMDLTIVGHPTVREKDGLAMSSRNTYLSPEEREKALLISQSIRMAERLFKEGERDVAVIEGETAKVLGSKGEVNIEYISISDADTLTQVERIEGRVVLAIACRIGKTRLIDNTILMEA